MAWLGIVATVAWNYRQHRHGRQTICSITRQVLPRPAFVGLWGATAVGLAIHVVKGYRAYQEES